MAFKDRLKQAREKKGLTQVELANLLGVSKGAVGNYESGASAAKEEIMYKIFDVLKVEPNFLFQDEFEAPIENGLSSTEQTLLENFRELNEEGQHLISSQANALVLSGIYKKHDVHGLDKQA